MVRAPPDLGWCWCFPEEESRCCSHFQLRQPENNSDGKTDQAEKKPLGVKSDVWVVSRKVLFLSPWNLCRVEDGCSETNEPTGGWRRSVANIWTCGGSLVSDLSVGQIC